MKKLYRTADGVGFDHGWMILDNLHFHDAIYICANFDSQAKQLENDFYPLINRSTRSIRTFISLEDCWMTSTAAFFNSAAWRSAFSSFDISICSVFDSSPSCWDNTRSMRSSAASIVFCTRCSFFREISSRSSSWAIFLCRASFENPSILSADPASVLASGIDLPFSASWRAYVARVAFSWLVRVISVMTCSSISLDGYVFEVPSSVVLLVLRA